MVVVAQQLCFDRGTVVAAVRRPLTGNLRRALRVELHRDDRPQPHGLDRAALAGCQERRAGRERDYRVVVGLLDHQGCAEGAEQGIVHTGVGQRHLGSAFFVLRRQADGNFAAETVGDDLMAQTDAEDGRAALDAFEASELGRKYPQSVKVWRDAWERFVPFLQFPPAARRVLYTTNSIESLNAELRKATRNRGQFPNDTAALKTLWLMICNIEDKRAAQRAKKAKRDVECNGYIEGAKATGWKQAINQLAVAYPDRFADYL